MKGRGNLSRSGAEAITPFFTVIVQPRVLIPPSILENILVAILVQMNGHGSHVFVTSNSKVETPSCIGGAAVTLSLLDLTGATRPFVEKL